MTGARAQTPHHARPSALPTAPDDTWGALTCALALPGCLLVECDEGWQEELLWARSREALATCKQQRGAEERLRSDVAKWASEYHRVSY